MPKKVSKRKTTRRPKKVSRKKSKRITKKKPKYKRRRRRFGSSLYEEPHKRSSLRTLLASFFTPQNPQPVDRAPGINTFATRFTRGDPASEVRNKTPNYKELVDGLRGTKKVMGLYNKFTGSSDFRIIGSATDKAIRKRHHIFHTWLVAIISAILQLLNEVGRSKSSAYFQGSRVEAKYLDFLSNPDSLEGIIEYTRDERKDKTRINNFTMERRGGRLVGFSWTFGTTDLRVSMQGQIDGTHLIINTILTDLEARMLQAENEISLKASDGFKDAVSKYLSIINLRNGDIQSSQVSQDNNSVNQLTEGLGNMTMTVNPMNTINTTVQAVNKSLNPFDNFKYDTKKTSDDNNPFAEFGPQDNDGPSPFDAFGPPQIEEVKSDGKQFAKTEKDSDGNVTTYLFGRRKRKRKVSKKKVSKKKGPSSALKKLCKRLKVKLTTKRSGKRVYKSEKVLKAQCKKAAKKSSFGKPKKKVSKKKGPSAALKKLCKRLKVKLTVKRGKKRVYKSEKVLKSQCKKAAKKSSFGKKKKRRRKRTSK